MILEAGKALRLILTMPWRASISRGSIMGNLVSPIFRGPRRNRRPKRIKLKPGKNQEAGPLLARKCALDLEKYPEAEADYLPPLIWTLMLRRITTIEASCIGANWPFGRLKWESAFRQAMALAPRNLSVRQIRP